MPKFIIPSEDVNYVISLRQDTEGVSIMLEDKDDVGSPWSIASLDDDGVLTLHSGIAKDSGIKVDSQGRIVVKNAD